MTNKQMRVYDTLVEIHNQTKEAVSPTAIGLKLGFRYEDASSKCMNALNKFINEGSAIKTDKGHYIPVENKIRRNRLSENIKEDW